MKKVINGAEYNNDTAEKICEGFYLGPDYEKGAMTKTLKQLYKTRSGKYFFYIIEKFVAEANSNQDDLNPIFEQMELVEERIVPISYDLASQFVSEFQEIYSKEDAEMIQKHFPELIESEIRNDKKYQKKIYLSESANWYLQMMLNENNDTNSSLVERLIRQEYRRLYNAGLMSRDPFFEMNTNE